LGAATLTPGAALLPFRDDLLEQLGWIAQEIEEMGGDAWVLPVNQLTDAEEARARDQVNAERLAEYGEVIQNAASRMDRAGHQPPSNRDVGALRRRLGRIQARDHYGAEGRMDAVRAVEDLARHSAQSSQLVAMDAI
jgi:hypothetical protein